MPDFKIDYLSAYKSKFNNHKKHEKEWFIDIGMIDMNACLKRQVFKCGWS